VAGIEKRTRSRIYGYRGRAGVFSARLGKETGLCRDLSLRGILMDYSGGLNPGDECTVSLAPEGMGADYLFRAQGRVVRSEGGSLAVEFLEMDENSFSHLVKLLEWNSEDPEVIRGEVTRPLRE